MPSLQHRPTIILANTQAGVHSSGGAHAYAQYIRHLEKTSDFYKALEAPASVQSFAQGYQDYLQAPLQVIYSSDRIEELVERKSDSFAALILSRSWTIFNQQLTRHLSAIRSNMSDTKKQSTELYAIVPVHLERECSPSLPNTYPNLVNF